MRYYVIAPSSLPEIAPHVIAEVVTDEEPEDDRRLSLAAGIAGSAAVIATREEMMASATGAKALQDWESGNDAEFDRETRLLDLEDEAPRHLRLVEHVTPEIVREQPHETIEPSRGPETQEGDSRVS